MNNIAYLCKHIGIHIVYSWQKGINISINNLSFMRVKPCNYLWLIAICVIIPFLSACSDDDDKIIGEKSIILNVGDTYKVKASGSASYAVQHQFVASVNQQGEVTANHVGETVMAVSVGNETAYCGILVSPRHNLWPTPVMDSPSYTIGQVKQYFNGKYPMSATSNTVTINPQKNNVEYIRYYVLKRIDSIEVKYVHNENAKLISTLDDYLTERYDKVKENEEQNLTIYDAGPINKYAVKWWLYADDNKAKSIIRYYP